MRIVDDLGVAILAQSRKRRIRRSQINTDRLTFNKFDGRFAHGTSPLVVNGVCQLPNLLDFDRHGVAVFEKHWRLAGSTNAVRCAS